MKKFIFGFLILLAVLFFKSDTFANEEYKILTNQNIVKVGISDNSFSKYLFDTVKITSSENFIITDNVDFEIEINAHEVITVKYQQGIFEIYQNEKKIHNSTNKLVFIPKNKSNIEIAGLKRKNKQAAYSGNIELVKSASNQNKFAIVNILPLQTYLKGVVPNEMPVYFGLEALKAQAILARNYVLKPRQKYYKEFDICDSVACQVYFGANTQESLSDKAVDETENITALYKGDLILAVYSSTAGGYSESYKNVFLQNTQKGIMSQNIPYLVATPDNDNIKDLSDEKVMREYCAYPLPSFDEDSPYYRWKREWYFDEFEQGLAKTIPSLYKTGFVKTKKEVNFSDPKYFGHLKSIYINKRGASGKIVALTLITDKNEFTIYKELILRKTFINNNRMLPSANFFVDFNKVDNKTKVVISGYGFGHGVGMSQWGAGKMAKNGYKYDDIIHHYYNGVDIATLPVVVSKETVSQSFYTNSKKSSLNIENKFHFSELNIIINNKIVDEEIIKNLLDNKSADISKYVKKGKNVITYEIKPEKKNKQIKFWIEFEK